MPKKLTRKTYAMFRNSTETGASTFGLKDIAAMRKRYDLERTEPIYRKLVGARYAFENADSEWSAISSALRGFPQGCKDPLFKSMQKSCRVLFALRGKLVKRLKKAEKDWAKREKEIKE